MTDTPPSAAPQGEVPPPTGPLKRYHPRSFGFEVEDGTFIEGTLWSEPSSPHLLNADGRYLLPDLLPALEAPLSRAADLADTTEDTWVPYHSIVHLGECLKWGQPEMQSFVGRLQRALAQPCAPYLIDVEVRDVTTDPHVQSSPSQSP